VKEVWKDIEGYEGLYQVSNLGRIKSLSRNVYWGKTYASFRFEEEKILNYIYSKNGYLRCQLAKDGKKHNYLVHRLVAMAFISNPDNKPEVNHIDGNKRNNYVTNLEWVTPSENQKHAFSVGLQKSKWGKANVRAKSILQYDLEGNLIKEHGCILDAVKFINKKPASRLYVTRCCQGKQKTAYGYVWKYKEI
jgi:hypothetical protein